MISTRQLEGLPDIPGFIRVTRSLAALDAVLSPEWEYRYYSFDSRWGQGEMMASMRNGSGDSWFALICEAGVVLHGLSHEAPIYRPGSPPAGEFDTLPPVLRDAFLAEPAFETRESTFCIWRLDESSKWETGPVQLPDGPDPDGSGELLRLVAGDPEVYVRFAAEYYERALALEDVAGIYRHEALRPDRVGRLNPSADLSTLRADLAGIGYPRVGW